MISAMLETEIQGVMIFFSFAFCLARDKGGCGQKREHSNEYDG
jgi:hypothetical protein